MGVKITLPAQVSRQLQAIHERHHEIENEDVEGGGFSQTQTGGAVVRNDDIEQLVFELTPHIVGHFAVVVNQQNTHLT